VETRISRSRFFLPQLHVEGGPAPDFGLEFHDLLLVVFIDVDIHRLLQKLWQIRDLDLSVGASKGLKIKLLYAHKAVPDTRGDLCAEDWLQVNAGYGYERGTRAKIRRNFRLRG